MTMAFSTFHLEPFFATVYALLLVAIAAGLEWMGRHSNQRAHRYHTAGFRFHQHTDHWECPIGTRLEKADVDHQLRVVRYRAPGETCNGCAIKSRCTDSDDGREIAVSLDPWLSSAIGRFHRGMSLAPLTLAALITLIELIRHDHGTERWVLFTAFVTITLLSVRRARCLRHPAES